jgi:hypothetical protein
VAIVYESLFVFVVTGLEASTDLTTYALLQSGLVSLYLRTVRIYPFCGVKGVVCAERYFYVGALEYVSNVCGFFSYTSECNPFMCLHVCVLSLFLWFGLMWFM